MKHSKEITRDQKKREAGKYCQEGRRGIRRNKYHIDIQFISALFSSLASSTYGQCATMIQTVYLRLKTTCQHSQKPQQAAQALQHIINRNPNRNSSQAPLTLPLPRCFSCQGGEKCTVQGKWARQTGSFLDTMHQSLPHISSLVCMQHLHTLNRSGYQGRVT